MGLFVYAWRSLSGFSGFVLLVLVGFTCILANLSDVVPEMSAEERTELKEEAREMFYHAYKSYMDNAYPADELMPLSCSGRWRRSEVSRGDIDDALGNFSLTLIDTLDTLVILGDVTEFERAAKLVIKDVSFDNDIVVSVFETNIRVLGGLLSAHVLAEHLQQQRLGMSWYRGELLSMAKDVGYILLPAFNSSTGIPYPRINLRYGLKSHGLMSSLETCTACAGTMILEMAALSRLTGDPIFEEKAHHAMDELWRLRHRNSDLMGTVLNIHSGDWVRRDSGVGAGIDSYYEYCLKAYILLGDDRYLGRFNKHYSAVMKYISQGPMLIDVLMHRPHLNSRNFMDALLAFWPGLQVLKGDIQPAVETHEMLYQVLQRHNFIPEAFTTDFQVYWAQAPLRPEFLESTYFLHRATGDPYYLEVGRSVLRSLQKYARVPCGFAAVKDVRTNIHEDRMDSFVLAETLKYLFLLFADPSDLILDLDQFVFTTEAHLLPLTLARAPIRTTTPAPASNSSSKIIIPLVETPDAIHYTDLLVNASSDSRTCPNSQHLFLSEIRLHLRNLVDSTCSKESRRKLRAKEFQVGNSEHLALLEEMGIKIVSLDDGRMQLLHALGTAKNSKSAEEGILFMQEMVELSKSFSQQRDINQQAVTVDSKIGTTVIKGGPAHFGRQLRGSSGKLSGRVQVASPLQGCNDLQQPEKLKGTIVILERGNCMFVDKARRIMKAGAIGGIVVDNVVGSSWEKSPLFAMSGDGTNDITIPMVFLFHEEAVSLLKALWDDPNAQVTLSSYTAAQEDTQKNRDSALDVLRQTIIKFLSSDGGKSKSAKSSRSGLSSLKFKLIGGEEEEENISSIHELLKGVAQQWDSAEGSSNDGQVVKEVKSETAHTEAVQVEAAQPEAASIEVVPEVVPEVLQESVEVERKSRVSERSCRDGSTCEEVSGASEAVLVEPPRQRITEQPAENRGNYLKSSRKDEL